MHLVPAKAVTAFSSNMTMDSHFRGNERGDSTPGQGPTFTAFRSRRTPASPAIIGFALTWQGDAQLWTCLPGHDPEKWIPFFGRDHAQGEDAGPWFDSVALDHVQVLSL
jgi:hypothetical protein